MRGPRLLLVVLLLAAFALTTIEIAAPGPFRGVRSATDRVLGPPQNALAAAARGLGSALGGSSKDAVRLRAENDRLRGELAHGQADARRAGQLDALLALRRPQLVPARVTAYGSGFGFDQTVTLDAGSRDGVRPGQTVVTDAGLVGRTTRVGPYTCTVLLLVDADSTAGVRLARAGTLGLATGDGDGLSLQLVRGAPPKPGEAMLTSGDSSFAADVPVGIVRAVKAGDGAPVVTATVQPLVDLSQLDLVGVLTGPGRAARRAPLPAATGSPSVP